MPHARPTPDELIGLLVRSRLPTIVIEGDDDVIVYRRFEETLKHIGVDVLAAGGRESVLEIFRARARFSHIKCVFIIDLDTWVLSGIPTEYLARELITTDGYSIENDIIRDGDLESLLVSAERDEYEKSVHSLVSWFSFVIDQRRFGHDIPIARHVNELIDTGHTQLKPTLSASINLPTTPSESFERIKDDYKKYLRGKTLFSLLLRYLSYAGRKPQHKGQALLETVAVKPGPILNRMRSNVEAALTG